MRLLVLTAVILCAAAVLTPGREASAQEARAPGTTYVVVQVEPGSAAEALARGASPLELLGYRRLPVPSSVDPAEYAHEISLIPGVLSAEVDLRVEAARVPNDTFYPGPQLTYLGPLGIEAAWDQETGGAEVTLAIIDTGVDLAHPDLAGRIWVNPGEVAGDGVDNDGNGCIDDVNGCRFTAPSPVCGYNGGSGTGQVADDHGTPGQPGQSSHSHGTLAAGIAGARGNNGIGVTGVAWDVRIMAVKVLDCGPLGTAPTGSMFDVAQAIMYATANGADVINLSLASQQSADDSDALRAAMTAARDAGVIVVAAVGNHSGANPGVGLPASYAGKPGFANVVAVASSDNRNGNIHATFSNYGSEVTVAAPGYSIAGTVRVAMSQSASQAYGSETGTSFSTPIVAGAAVLLKSRNPTLTGSEIVTILRESATPSSAGPPNWAGSGVINFGAAMGRVPLSLSGTALHNWKDVASGSIVAAVIGNTVCGSTTVTNSGGVAAFALRVDGGGEKAGCGALGRNVTLFINGSTAAPAVPWAAPDTPLVVAAEFSTSSPPPGPLVVQAMRPGWNNIAHLAPAGSLPGAVSYLPGGWTTLFHWDALAAVYERYGMGAPGFVQSWPIATQFDAYWVDATAASNFAYTNPNIPERTTQVVELEPGWNNFVYSGPARQVAEALAVIDGSYDQVMQYNNVTGAWSSYSPELPRAMNGFEGLLELQVYWIYMTESETLVME